MTTDKTLKAGYPDNYFDFDEKLIAAVQQIGVDAAAVQQALRGYHQGCSCDNNSMCAFHTTTYNALGDVIKTVDTTIANLRKGG